MAHTLRLSYGGSQINFNSGSITLRQYVPESPNLSTIDANSILRDGGRRTLTSRRNVTEGCQILVNPTSSAASDIQAAKHNIQQWLLNAEHYGETGAGSKVYVEYAPDGLSGSVYRSKLFGGKVDVADNSLDTRWTKNRAVELQVTWTREYFWEGDEVTVTLENSGSTSTCSTVWNQNPLDYTGQSGCYNNWVQISGSNVNGEIDSPATIEIHNRTGTMAGPRYHLFHGIGGNITSLPTTLEAEDTTTNSGGSSADIISTCSSGGYYRRACLFEHTDLWFTAITLALPSGSLQKLGGKNYNVVMAYESTQTTDKELFFKPTIRDSQGPGGGAFAIIDEGPAKEVYNPIVAEHVQPLGVTQIPPGIIDETGNIEDEWLVINYKLYTADEIEMDIDCVYLMPVDGYRFIEMRGSYGFTTNDYITDHSDEDKVLWTDSSESATYPSMRWKGNPIALRPNEDQRIYLIHQDSGDYDPFRRHGIKVKYRPRRLTI